jgi:VanZ family protein
MNKLWLYRLHALIFAGFLIAWSVALLLPVPQERAERTLGGPWEVFLFGKGLHISAYFYLTVLGGTMAFAKNWWKWLLVGLWVHGGLTEFLQQFTGRTASLRDWGLDSVGVLLGSSIVWWWWRPRSSQSAAVENANG